MIQQIIGIVAPLFIIAGVGYFYGSRVRPEMRITNRLILDVFMPALIFNVMLRDDFHPMQMFNLVLAGVLLMLMSGLIAYVLAKPFGFNWRAITPPAMFCNWANLGIPLYVFALGESALGAGVMLVVVGNILCFTLGTYIYAGRTSSIEFLKTPIIVAVIVGLLFNLTDLALPVFISKPVEMLGQVAIPLMLFSLGVRLTRVTWNDSLVGVVMAIFCPLVGVALALILCQLIPMSILQQNVLILFGVLPPAVMNFMLAEQYNCEQETVASIVLIGNLFAIVSIPLVLVLVLQRLA